MTYSRISHTQLANDKNRLLNIKGLPQVQRKEARFGKSIKYLCAPLLQVFVLGSFLFLAGCAKKEAENAVPQSQQLVGINDLKKYLANASNTGEEKVIYNAQEKVFTIDGDMLISREEAEKYFHSNQGARTEHRRGAFIVSDLYVRNIKVYIDPTIPADWATATRRGLFNWNYINSRIRFSEVPNINGADIGVGATFLPADPAIARAFLPSSSQGRPGNPITINTRFNFLLPNQKEAVMIHELGHTLGFSHTDVPFQGDQYIPGTPPVDPLSVMKASVDITPMSTPWTGFSPGDMIAIFTLYPR